MPQCSLPGLGPRRPRPPGRSTGGTLGVEGGLQDEYGCRLVDHLTLSVGFATLLAQHRRCRHSSQSLIGEADRNGRDSPGEARGEVSYLLRRRTFVTTQRARQTDDYFDRFHLLHQRRDALEVATTAAYGLDRRGQESGRITAGNADPRIARVYPEPGAEAHVRPRPRGRSRCARVRAPRRPG
jgi:hypothetical protein